MSANMAKVTLFLLAKTPLTNRRNNKCTKIQALEKKRRQEGTRNVRKFRKNHKSNRDFFS